MRNYSDIQSVCVKIEATLPFVKKDICTLYTGKKILTKRVFQQFWLPKERDWPLTFCLGHLTQFNVVLDVQNS